MTDDQLADNLCDIFYNGPVSMRESMLEVLRFVREHDRPPEPEKPWTNMFPVDMTMKPKRVPVQIAINDDEIYALSNDGRIHGGISKAAFEWEECLPDLPQD